MNVNIHYTIDHIAKYTGGKLINRNITLPAPAYLSLDSRKITFPELSIFFAIKTSHRNANEFIAELYEKGVRNFVTDNKKIDVKKIPLSNVIVVDAVIALQKLAIHQRNQFNNLQVIGITGSNGKTIVKEWLNQLLEKDFSIVRSPRSYNSQIGVPLSVLNINSSHNLAIFESGISCANEMENLEKIINPTIGILTNIGQAHDEGFETKSQKIQEKLKLFIGVKHIIFCAEDKGVKNELVIFKNKIKINNPKLKLFSWGKQINNDLQILSIKKSNNQTKIDGVYKEKNISISIPFTDEASVENAINCWCALLVLDKATKNITERFSLLYPIAMRLEVKQGINHCTIINDSYSNDLHSLEIALNFLQHQKHVKKHTVILSDILQSRLNQNELYSQVAELVMQKKVNKLIGIGPDIFSYSEKFSFLKEKYFFHAIEDFFKYFSSMLFQDEAVLIKGARSFSFERISHLLEEKIHQTILSINLNAIVHNIKEYKKLLRPTTKIMAMVKAFSYGSGSYEIASLLEYHKVDYLAVAYADEGVELRKAGITLPIMVMNAEISTFESLINYNLEPEIFSFGILNEFKKILKSSGMSNYPIHIKIDTGMHRLGFIPDDMNELIKIISGGSLVKVMSVFTHLVASENKDEDEFTLNQTKVFTQLCKTLELAVGYQFDKHIANTSAISRFPQLQMDMVRLGIGLYGTDSNQRMQKKLKNVSTLTTTVAQIKKVKAGESVGYGRNAKIERDSIIATVRIGYADGYPRNLGNGKGKMFIKGDFAPVIGNVCMDMTMLDVTDLQMIDEGQDVIVFGEFLPISTLAAWAQTIPYEIMTGISQRVKRIYFEE